ncbi:MAG: S9 family peptidase [Silvibacterium sp.]|nr:S9 family peptidase [Silvibacterium sp.]
MSSSGVRKIYDMLFTMLKVPPVIALPVAAITALCALSPCHLYAASDTSFPTNEDLRHIRAMAQPRLSPDGRNVLIQITDSTVDGAKSHLWIVDIRQNAPRQLTWSTPQDKRGEFAGRWMPDGRSILFLAHRGEHTQLYRLPMEAGEARPYDLKVVPPVDASGAPDAIPPRKDAAPAKAEPVAIDVENYEPSPDGKLIALLAKDPETPGEKKQHDDKADAVWVDHEQHGSRLYLLDPDTDKLTPAAVSPDVHGIAWNRQGDRLIAIAAAMNGAGDLAPANTAWIVTASDPAHPTQIKELPATIQGGTWSSDGKRYYFLAQAEQDAPPGYHDLYALTLADNSIKDVTPKFDGSISRALPLADGDKVLTEAQLGVQIAYLRIDAGKQSPGKQNADTLKFPTSVVTQLETNTKQDGWVWLGTSSTEPVALFYAEKLGHDARTLNTPSLLPATWPKVPSQLVQWKNETLSVEGLLYLPPQASSAKVPLIVDVHGGPTGAFEDRYDPFIVWLVGQGWAVLRPNPRGSTGYGSAFAAANKNDLGGTDYRDIISGVDTVIAKYPIDPNKLGLMGYSYGGEMAAFVEGKTDRFKAIVSGAPVIDQHSEYGTESDSYYDRWFYGRPWEHASDAWRQSPLAEVAHAKTPFLLLQGEADKTDPLGQSQEMYRALRQIGVPVQLVQYPREDHGPLATGIFGNPSPEPWHGYDARQRILKFFKTAFGE